MKLKNQLGYVGSGLVDDFCTEIHGWGGGATTCLRVENATSIVPRDTEAVMTPVGCLFDALEDRIIHAVWTVISTVRFMATKALTQAESRELPLNVLNCILDKTLQVDVAHWLATNLDGYKPEFAESFQRRFHAGLLERRVYRPATSICQGFLVAEQDVRSTVAFVLAEKLADWRIQSAVEDCSETTAGGVDLDHDGWICGYVHDGVRVELFWLGLADWAVGTISQVLCSLRKTGGVVEELGWIHELLVVAEVEVLDLWLMVVPVVEPLVRLLVVAVEAILHGHAANVPNLVQVQVVGLGRHNIVDDFQPH